MPSLVFISDTHTRLADIDVPDGDILVHCGDFCRTGRMEEVEQFNSDMAALPHRHKIAIPGNHDWPFFEKPVEARRLMTSAAMLVDEGLEVEGLKFWGSPWVPEYNEWAFGLPRGSAAMGRVRDLIPEGVDVLITHSPPFGIRDNNHMLQPVGCELLLARLRAVKPRIHAFGHVHEDYGWRQTPETIFVNAASMNYRYQPVNRPVVIEL